ncbi:MAG: DEAD/DEAH box helicase [Pseudomonadota bacterium]|nr:DEAD/DEAH box helicase [Pseudomonadota bacterium]
MLPSIVASELKVAVAQYLRTAFPIATPYFQGESSVQGASADPHALIDALIERPGELFKGPYLDIKLPFRLADNATLPFRHLSLPFTPYRHQQLAFQRLCGDAPQSTIVATGTGSGKTECFMLPVLDDCLHRRERGIKTIIVYPMNALATDQARRFAKEVAALDTKLTVGLFVGGEGNKPHQSMGPENVITCQKTLCQYPPDVLLTNYKMLDFLLIRPKDQPLWRYNTPGMLRYLVVDELHSFDGAQGTDLACLIRRLRDRLEAGQELACVGTSATMGSDDALALLAYASEVFATPFSPDGIIGEDRVTPQEYLHAGFDPHDSKDPVRFYNWPTEDLRRLDPAQYDDANDYLFHQARLWFADLPLSEVPQLNASQPRRRAEAAVRLGELLHTHHAFHQLIHLCSRLQSMDELASVWAPEGGADNVKVSRLLLLSMSSLIAAARLWSNKDHVDPKKWCQPLLQVRQQLWLRELRRLVCSVPADDESPVIRFADDLRDPLNPLHLPLMHCRECHLAAWGAVARRSDPHLNGDLQDFYQAWFGYSSQVRLLVPVCETQEIAEPTQMFCPVCLRLQADQGNGSCIECEKATLRRVWVPDMLRSNNNQQDKGPQSHHNCPDCGARDAMVVMGYRAATLTGVMTGKLFATPYNDDYKLIAFSDSVQDAAHRAGFLGANTWRQVIRQTIAIWLKQKNVPLPLSEVKELLPMFWRDQIGHDGRFCGLFMPPNLEYHRDYDYLQQHNRLPERTELTSMISKRLAWECVAEFGRRSGVGRSLERTQAASVAWDTNVLEPVVALVASQLREEIGSLREVSDDSFMQFILGLLHHWRVIGAIYDPVLEGYITSRGKEFQINRIPWMPGFGKSQRPPAAISLQHLSNNFEALTVANRDTWAVRWLKKTLGTQALFAAADARQVFSILINALSRKNCLKEIAVNDQSVWMLNPDKLLIDAAAVQIVCDGCRHRYTVSPAMVSLYDRMPCLRPNCAGYLHPFNESPSTVRDFVLTTPRRLVPHEHTGLLLREEREAVERSFIGGTEPWDINLLSATPTLEMGIDIGDLSSVFLCSVPPAQANYLQRIGRAGRKDGNALAVTVANGQNHDLFFYSDPMEMMDGAVQTPGVFLNAIAVLERQLIAYCFDRWVITGIDESAIPGQLRKVLDAVEKQHTDRFPYNLIAFVAGNKQALLAGFLAMFGHLDEDATGYLDNFISEAGEGSLSWRLVNRLQGLVDERAALVKKTRLLKLERERLSQQPEDEAQQDALNELDRERSGILSLLEKLNGQMTLNFFTDEGLLPNYAFPEEGVTLRSVILRRKSEAAGDDESPYEKLSYSFQRPAQAALSELAPSSTFYAISREMEIEQIDLQLSRPEDWRFCNRCQHTERVDPEDRHSACPKCGSAQWADSKQRHTVLKLRQVYATVDDRSSRISDEAEQREPVFFNRQTLVDIPDQNSIAGFRLKSDELPFGFEFLRRAVFREVNFGQRGGESNVFSVAGDDCARQGFRICRHCGKVQKNFYRRHEHPHAYTCKLRKQPELDGPEEYFESLYLYRELQSEAIRILLPLSEVAYSDEKLHSFVAALNLGLRAYFKGSVQHLEVTDMREPGSSNSGERIFLVVYDKIPGGTGFLKELMRSPDNLLRVLELARDKLMTCACADQEHLDGCYRCILAYRNARNMASISRQGAAQLMGDILALRDQIEPVASLSDIDTNVLIESKLEQRFVDALGMLPGAHVSRILLKGKKASLLTLPGADGRPIAWHVEHQVKMGPLDGVLLNTQIDVVLTPAREEQAAQYRPIAVYVDGLQYHHDIVEDDVAKRSALLCSKKFWVFSLNWDDLPEPGKLPVALDSNIMRLPGAVQRPLSELYDQLANKDGVANAAQLAGTTAWGSLELLSRILRDPALTLIELPNRATHRALTTLLPQRASDMELRAELASAIQALAPPSMAQRLAADDMAQVPGGFSEVLGNAEPLVELLTAVPIATMRQPSIELLKDTLVLHLCFDDREQQLNEAFKAGWRTFWHAVNQLQFLPQFSMATRKLVDSGTAEQIWQAAVYNPEETPPSQQTAMDATLDSAWAEVFDLTGLDHVAITNMQALGLPAPEVGVDLMDDHGEIVLSGNVIELCWTQSRVAVVTDAAELQGWHFIVADEGMLDKLTALREQGVF